jgi:hypothetical protein
MNPCRVLAGVALASLCLPLSVASAQTTTGSRDDIGVADATAAVTAGDLILDDDFDGQRNGGTSCDTATELTGDTTFSADTTSAPDWIGTLGPLMSPSNDVVYAFVAGSDVGGAIIPTSSSYTFAIYLIESCSNSGSEPQPIGATATIGRGIDLAASGVTSGHTYYLVVTGIAAGGAGANGLLNFTTPASLIAAPRF